MSVLQYTSCTLPSLSAAAIIKGGSVVPVNLLGKETQCCTGRSLVWGYPVAVQVGKIVEGGNVNLVCRRISFRKISKSSFD